MSNPVHTAHQALNSRALQQRNQRVNRYRALVTPIAVHYGRRCPEPLDDLVQVGLLGLLRAAELFQPQTTTPFEAFARPHIRGAILHYLRDAAPVVRLPRRQMEWQDRIRQFRAAWLCEHGQEPTPENLRQGLGLTRQHWQDLLRGQAMARPLPLAPELENRLAAGESVLELSDPLAQAEVSLLGQLSCLESDLRQVVQKVVLAGWSYRRTAALLQVSPMTVQRRLKRGLALLKLALVAVDSQPPGQEPRINPDRQLRPVASVVPAC